MPSKTVRVGSARIDERGQAKGGKAGDNNGREVSMQEKWADVPGFEGIYRVSTTGRLCSLPRTDARGWHIKGRIMSTDKGACGGYPRVNLFGKGKKRLSVPIHRLVAEAFIPNPDNLPQVNHKDGNKLNNTVENLEWVSCSENVAHAVRTGLMTNHFFAMYGEAHPGHKYSDAQVEDIRRMYASGIKGTAIARKYGMSKAHVYKILRGGARMKGSEIHACCICG